MDVMVSIAGASFMAVPRKVCRGHRSCVHVKRGLQQSVCTRFHIHENPLLFGILRAQRKLEPLPSVKSRFGSPKSFPTNYSLQRRTEAERFLFGTRNIVFGLDTSVSHMSGVTCQGCLDLMARGAPVTSTHLRYSTPPNSMRLPGRETN